MELLILAAFKSADLSACDTGFVFVVVKKLRKGQPETMRQIFGHDA